MNYRLGSKTNIKGMKGMKNEQRKKERERIQGMFLLRYKQRLEIFRDV